MGLRQCVDKPDAGEVGCGFCGNMLILLSLGRRVVRELGHEVNGNLGLFR